MIVVVGLSRTAQQGYRVSVKQFGDCCSLGEVVIGPVLAGELIEPTS